MVETSLFPSIPAFAQTFNKIIIKGLQQADNDNVYYSKFE